MHTKRTETRYAAHDCRTIYATGATREEALSAARAVAPGCDTPAVTTMPERFARAIRHRSLPIHISHRAYLVLIYGTTRPVWRKAKETK